MKTITIILVLLLASVTILLADRTPDPDKIHDYYTKDEIIEAFKKNRTFEWVDRYNEKSDGIYILTSEWYYQVMLEQEDNSLYFRGRKSRAEYDRMVPFWIIIGLFVVAGVIILIIILSSLNKRR